MTMPMPMVDPDDPKFKGKSWEAIEAELAIRDAEQVAVLGYDVDGPEEQGPNFFNPSRPLYAPFPWEERIDGFEKPASCTHKNWKHKCLTFTIGKGCATLKLTSPDTNNSVNPEMLDALQDAIMDLQTQKDVRVVILKSEGKLFCNGIDPKYIMSESNKSEAEIAKFQMQFAKVLYFLSQLPQYVVALVQGSAMGAGIGLLCACDMVYSVKGAFFAMNEGKLGVVPTVSLPFIMQRMIYTGEIRQLVLLHKSFSATQAKEAGLIDEVCEDQAQLESSGTDMLNKMTLCAPGAVATTKEVIMNTIGQAPHSFMLNYVAATVAAQRRSPEAKMGIEAVQARKKPPWAESPISM